MKRFLNLMRKDWRLNRAAVVGLLVMNAMAYGLGIGTYLWDRYTFVPTASHYLGGPGLMGNSPPSLDHYLQPAIGFGLIFAALASAVFGGIAFALERRERSADFLAMLPVRRNRIIASKLVVAISIMAAALVSQVVIFVLNDFQRQWETGSSRFEAIFHFAASEITLFGIAWLLSTFMESAAIAASVAIGLAAGLTLVLAICWQTPGKGAGPEIAMCITCALGIFFVTIGSVYYRNRVAP